MQNGDRNSPVIDLWPAVVWLDFAQEQVRLLQSAQHKLLNYSQEAIEITCRHRRQAADLAGAMIGELQQIGPSPAAITVWMGWLNSAMHHTIEEANEQVRAGCAAMQQLSESGESVVVKLVEAWQPPRETDRSVTAPRPNGRAH